MPTIISPSLLAADFTRLGDEVAAIEAAGADWLHLDIMDGHFVPNISYGPGLVKAMRPLTRIPFDVHLMIAPADPYLEAFAKAGANHILVHPEAGPHLHRSLQAIRDLGCKAGVVLNPATLPASIDYVLDLLDVILVMTVNPGFGGQAFLPGQLPKIAKLRAMIEQSGRDIVLEVDGGVSAETAPLCLQAGANALVSGTAVFGADDYAQAIAALRGNAQESVPLRGNAQESATPRGNTQESAPLRGNAQESAPLRGNAQESATPRGNAQESVTLRGNAQASAAPRGHGA